MESKLNEQYFVLKLYIELLAKQHYCPLILNLMPLLIFVKLRDNHKIGLSRLSGNLLAQNHSSRRGLFTNILRYMVSALIKID